MKQTEHYQLNQWDPVDRILREDFNADNLKIAQALAGKMEMPEIHQVFPEKETPISACSCDFVNFNWNDWKWAGFFCDTTATEKIAGDYITLRANAIRTPFATIEPGSFLVIFFPMYDDTRIVQGVAIGGNTTFFKVPELTFHNLSFVPITIISEQAAIMTPRRTVWGIR